MPFVHTKLRRWSEAVARRWPWLAGAVGLVLLGWFYNFLADLGSRPSADGSPVAGRAALNAEQSRLSDDIGEREKKYQRMTTAGIGGDEAIALLDRALETQRRLLQLNPRAGVEQNVRLERLTAARDTEHAQLAVKKIAELENAADEERRAGRPAAAVEKLRAALALQREVDNSNADGLLKNFSREMSLVQEIETAEAEPIAQEFEIAMKQAHAAVAEQRWADALAAFGRARDAQTRINHDYARTRFTDLTVLNDIETEIASLNAAGAAAEIDAREKDADAAAELGRAKAAAGLYQAAYDLQRELNAKFERSRFVSTQRLAEIEIKRQTALAAEMLTAAVALDRAAAAALLKRRVLAAERKIAAAVELLERVEADYPKARNFDGALKIKLAYLDLRRPELRTLQDWVYDRLVPVPEVKNLLMLKTEVPQEFYARVMSTNPSRNVGGALPVDSVSWNDAQEFCRRLSWLLGTRVRLPAEMEFRAALGSGDMAAWSAEASAGHSQETGGQAANAAGFYDLTGNVAEWLQPAAADSLAAPVAGGSYLDAGAELKKIPLAETDKNERARHIGFRVVVEFPID